MNATTMNVPTMNATSAHATTRFLPFVGRLLIGGIFMMSGLSKLPAYTYITAAISGAGLPFAPLGFAVALVVEIGLGLLLAIGYRTRAVAFGFLLPSQLCGSEHDDPLPEEPDDGGRTASDRALRSRRCQFGRTRGPLTYAVCAIEGAKAVDLGRRASRPRTVRREVSA
jgi:hypothetical protein